MQPGFLSQILLLCLARQIPLALHLPAEGVALGPVLKPGLPPDVAPLLPPVLSLSLGVLAVLVPPCLKASGGAKAREPPHTFSPLSETDFGCDWVRKPQVLLSDVEASVSSNEKCAPHNHQFIYSENTRQVF